MRPQRKILKFWDVPAGRREWYDCPSEGSQVITVASQPPNRSIYCKSCVDERVGGLVLILGGRMMNKVVNDIRAYGSTDSGSPYSGWGPLPSAHPQLTSIPEGATMEYRGNQPTATPVSIATVAIDQVRLAPSPTSGEPFNNWAFASGLDQMIAMYPGSLADTVINANSTLFVWFDTATPSDVAYTDRVELRMALDANGSKARFTQHNRLVSNGFTTHYSTLLDTTYTVETLSGVKLLRFAATPAGFEDRFRFQRMFAERSGGVWYAFKDTVAAEPIWTIRLNSSDNTALRTALGIPQARRGVTEIERRASWRRQAWPPRGGLFHGLATWRLI